MRSCAHCGLPVGGRGVEAAVDGVRAEYCCYGCVLARQVTRGSGDDARLAAVAVRLVLAGFLTANVLMASMPSWVPAFYGTEGTDGPGFVALRWLALALGAPVLALLGWPILRTVGRARILTSAEGLVVLGAVAAWTLSFVHVLRGRTEIFVDTACLLLIFVTVGRLVEARARARVGAALGASEDPASAPARRRGEAGWEACRAGDLRPGDVVRVGPGEGFPADGVVLAGAGGMSEAVLTGEARPVPARAGTAVAGGAASVDGTFDVRVTAPVGESARGRIERLVREALLTPSSGERLADRAATILVPAAALLAAAAGLWWWRHAGIDQGLMVALAVLVVACPCALGSATPAAVATALAHAARAGVLVRGGGALEWLGTLGCVVFDKTGTLTETVPGLVGVAGGVPDRTAARALAWAAAVERDQPHPIARAIVRAAAATGLPALEATDVRILPGAGVEGRVGDRRVAIVRGASGGTVDVVADGRPVLAILVDERVRAGVPEALAALAGLGIDVRVLSGDRSAAALASLVPPERTCLALGPEDKVAAVRALEAAHRHGVAMVGDGLNDAPTLAAAAVGIAVGSATDLARRAADVVLLVDDVGRVPWLIGLARRTRRVLRQNLAWAATYNAGALAAAAAGALSPVVAAVVMLASSVTIVANSRRLGRGALPAGSQREAGVGRTGERELDDGLGAAARAGGEVDAAAVGLDYLPAHR